MSFPECVCKPQARPCSLTITTTTESPSILPFFEEMWINIFVIGLLVLATGLILFFCYMFICKPKSRFGLHVDRGAEPGLVADEIECLFPDPPAHLQNRQDV
ncbi:hypothetical protein L5515_017655 [Caenorhabditis briggsae]|uniref:Uncharacterized protein n=1 Tax=Caenorhabditis briggsae TaxID=6238 RepID=A0AAE9FG24_CAEBR|nr:hypothetical protein L5515_017655 [Caenorhabditis briggsae]